MELHNIPVFSLMDLWQAILVSINLFDKIGQELFVSPNL